ncbi:unnamed protein product [Schistocephalus solidus]|uniref:Uncharacterized protein n=1 Tax=Schistocephalus solidus TaxID=70667 RepID=A0A183T5J3_SCHSO|nr:unnamed protein product [Schistocephalus solidus]
MADIVQFLPNYAVCAGIITAVVLVLSFILCRCLTGKPSVSLAQKSKLKKGKEKKKPEGVQAANKPPEVEVLAMEEDEWVTVKHGKSTHGPQPVDTSTKTNQKPKQAKPESKESTPKETKNSHKAKKSAQPKPQRSSDEELPVTNVPNPPKPVVLEPAEGKSI